MLQVIFIEQLNLIAKTKVNFIKKIILIIENEIISNLHFMLQFITNGFVIKCK